MFVLIAVCIVCCVVTTIYICVKCCCSGGSDRKRNQGRSTSEQSPKVNWHFSIYFRFSQCTSTDRYSNKSRQLSSTSLSTTSSTTPTYMGPREPSHVTSTKCSASTSRWFPHGTTTTLWKNMRQFVILLSLDEKCFRHILSKVLIIVYYCNYHLICITYIYSKITDVCLQK